MYLLIPGRHHIITKFQYEYLSSIVKQIPGPVKDVRDRSIQINSPVTAIIFGVTSANHSNTRRNPLPFYLRAIAIEAMGNMLNVPVYIYGVDDVGSLSNFADYTIKRIAHESDGLINCTPQNTLVVCSTQVLQMYEQLGFSILPAELADITNWQHHTAMPWDIAEQIAAGNETFSEDKMHESSLSVWRKYRWNQKIKLLFSDAMIGSDGDLTETRDYNVYVRQMDDIAELKYHDTAPFIQPGRIGDIGCAVGSWIKLASKDERLRESDFYGIEVSRHLFEICRQRKENGEFGNPFVFFSQKNAVTGLVFNPDSMNTIHTSSLTHEIESYGSRNDLPQFIKNRYDELRPGGVWINRDVVAPYNKEQQVFMWLNKNDGSNENPLATFEDRHELSQHLKSLSTFSRFIRFANDFRKQEGYRLLCEVVEKDRLYIKLSLKDACEFLSRKDYTDNWQSEMHETFCFWDFEEWKTVLINNGFTIHPSSAAFTNNWIAENRWKGKALLLDETFQAMEWPVTNMILIGIRN